MTPARALFCANTNASGAPGAEAARALIAAGGVEIVEPEDGEFAEAAIARLAREVDAILIGGGDGTINRAAPALLKARKPVGLIPLGTANDLARTLQINSPEMAAQAILGGRTRALDIGLVDGRPFFNVANIGYAIAITKRQTPRRKRLLRVFSYALSAFEAWREVRRFSVKITADGESRIGKAVQIAIGNGVFYGGGMRIAEDAAIDDGRLDVYVIWPRTLLDMVLLAPRLRSGRLAKARNSFSLTAERVEVITKRAQEIGADGEIVSTTPALFEVRRAALDFFVPPEVAPTALDAATREIRRAIGLQDRAP